MFELLDALASCLDRDSARRINKVQFDELIHERYAELREKERLGTLSRDEEIEFTVDVVSLNFLALLQRKYRAILRKPAKPLSHAVEG